MARTALTIQEENTPPEAGVVLDFTNVDVTNGNAMDNDGRTVLHAKGVNAGTLRFTCHVRGVEYTRDVVVGAGEDITVGPFTAAFWNEHDPADVGVLYVDQVGGSPGDIQVAPVRQKRAPVQ